MTSNKLENLLHLVGWLIQLIAITLWNEINYSKELPPSAKWVGDFSD